MATTSKIFIIVLFFILLAFLIQKDTSKYFGPAVLFGETRVKVEIVDTPKERELGLSGRDSLREGTGMLFVFEQTGKYPFWMKDMHFAIDIIWLNPNKEIVYIKKDATPESFPEAFGGEVEAKYVLEVASGFAEEHNLQMGDKAEINF